MSIKDEHLNNAMDDLLSYEKKETIKLLSAFKCVIQKINYPSERIKDYLRDGNNFHIGYCQVYENIGYKSGGYPGYRFYNVADNKDYHIPQLLMRQDDNGDDNFHCLVWQTTTCCEDDYQGYILFPLIDNTYWIVRFEL